MKRLMSFLLSMVLLWTVCTVGGLQASAASRVKTSDEAIALLKKFEGFSAYPYRDHSQYTVGYGTKCPEEDYERLMKNGISKQEADGLLRQHLVSKEKDLDRFIRKYGLELNQGQYDALMLFTYNVGIGWMYKDSTFRGAVINGAEGNDFLFAFSRWSKAGKSVSKGLVERRLVEANLYLNGIYSKEVPEYYSYVLFDVNPPESVDRDDIHCGARVQGYDVRTPAAIRAEASLEGWRFLGWYTEDGTWVTDLDDATRNLTLYAHWQKEDETPVSQENSYQRWVSRDGLQAFETPDLQAQTVDVLNMGQTVQIVADCMDASGIKWGQLASGGWIDLMYTRSLGSSDDMEIVGVTVEGEYVNIRSGAGTTYPVVTTVEGGTILHISQTLFTDGTLWGRYDKGWICLDYTDFNQLTQQETPDLIPAVARAVTCRNLRIRTDPGTEYPAVGVLPADSRVELYDIRVRDGKQWGRISEGWIALQDTVLEWIGG